MSHRILLRKISKLSSSATKTPYLLLGKEVIGNSPCGGKLVNYNLYDPRNEEQVKIENQILPKNLCSSSSTVGSSRGWLAMMNKQDYIINLINIFNNNTISLPPLIKDDETERLLNVSVSSSPNEDEEEEEEDCLVAVRFHGSRLDLCRLSNPELIRINVPCTPAFGLSPVMYSDRDGKFYLNSRSVDYIGYTDFKSRSGLEAPVSGYVRYPFSNFHELENHLRFFPSPNVQQLLVQSPSGESSFVVLWDMNLLEKEDKIMVFKENKEKGKSEYVTEINDLCIFIGLGDNEPFCLSASEYPGLQPNSVYFAGYCSTFGVYDLASNTIRYLSDKPRYLSPHSRLFWLPPTRSIMDSAF